MALFLDSVGSGSYYSLRILGLFSGWSAKAALYFALADAGTSLYLYLVMMLMILMGLEWLHLSTSPRNTPPILTCIWGELQPCAAYENSCILQQFSDQRSAPAHHAKQRWQSWTLCMLATTTHRPYITKQKQYTHGKCVPWHELFPRTHQTILCPDSNNGQCRT